jgi:hypothetical protein
MFIIKVNIKEEKVFIINFYNNISKIIIIIILRYILRYI